MTCEDAIREQVYDKASFDDLTTHSILRRERNSPTE